MTLNILLFLIILLEGYVVLSSELIAMRQIISFVGSGTDTMSIIIAAVLMPMAFGYYFGGKFEKKLSQTNYRTIRGQLLRNIFISLIFLIPGLSYGSIELFFNMLTDLNITNRITLTTIYATTFLVIPVFLLAQTIPLISLYFRKRQLAETAGTMLFFSTLGSFLGAVFSTLVLMAYLGIFNTVIITIVSLVILFIILSRKKFTLTVFIVVLLGIAGVLLNSPAAMTHLNIVASTRHHTIKVKDMPNQMTIFSLNNNNSSGIYRNENLSLNDRMTAFRYAKFIDKTYLDPIKYSGDPKQILVIGAGGFTIGFDDKRNAYTFLDIDADLKDHAEEHFLPERLAPNKIFYPIPARGFIRKAITEEKTYDIIILDAYIGAHTLPEHLVTIEFFNSIKEILNQDSILIMNLQGSPTFNNQVSVNLDATIKAAYGTVSRQIIQPYNGWLDHNRNSVNTLYIYHHRDYKPQIYTDNLNRAYADREKPVQ